jgi:uncharacterized protein Usg
MQRKLNYQGLITNQIYYHITNHSQVMSKF